MQPLSKAQIKYLRKLSHQHKPIFQLGKLGLTDVFIEQVDQALNKRELVKFNILQNSDEEIEDVAITIATQLEAHIVQVIGHSAVLYRPSSIAKYQKISEDIASIR